MLYPAGRSDYLGFMPYRFVGGYLDLWRDKLPLGDRFNLNTGETWSEYSSIPEGYAGGGAWALPIVSGGMAAADEPITLTTTGQLLSGGPMAGDATLSLSTDGSLSLVVAMSGGGTLTLSVAGGLSLSIAMSGDAGLSLSTSGGLSMIVPFAGDAALSLSGTANLKGLLSLETGVEDTTLTAAGVAQAVWDALAADSNAAGTMGALLNAAGAGGNPWAVALEGSYTAADLIRVMASVLAGKVSGMEAGAPVFRSVDDAEDRVAATTTADGNRLAVTVTP